MPYVQRDARGVVIGEFANLQAGFAEEWLSVEALSLLQADTASATERAWRDAELASLVWLRDRHRDQLDIGVETTLSVEQFTELLTYMQALRDWPQSPDFPQSAHRPVAPPWITEQTQ
jgi:hypothetical protein